MKWITLINQGYIEYTRNFLKSMDVYSSHFPLIIYCLDEVTMNAFPGSIHANVFLYQTDRMGNTRLQTYRFCEA